MTVIMKGRIKWGFRRGSLKTAFMKLMLTEINRRIKANWAAIKNDIKKQIELNIKHSDIADQLRTDGQLAADFGIKPGEGEKAIEKIAQQVANSCDIHKIIVRRSSGNFTGGIRIGLILDDYSDVLALREAFVVFTNNQTGNKDILTWLKWLLLEGNSIIQLPNPGNNKNGGKNTWDVLLGSFPQGDKKGLSRSGNAFMIKSPRAFRVTAQYSGTTDDNWLTRLFSGTNGDTFNLRVRTILEHYTA